MRMFEKTGTLSHNGLDVLTFDPGVDLDLTKELQSQLSSILNPSDKLYQNYIGINFQDFIAVSIFLKQKIIRGFSSVWHRPFYPKKTVRIFNRWYEDGALRKNTNTVLGAHTVAALKHQILFSKEKGYKWVFISREKNKKVLSRISKEICLKTNYEFFFHYDKIPICCRKNPSCWQWVAYCQIYNEKGENWEMLQPDFIK